jgi:hypothetical protein
MSEKISGHATYFWPKIGGQTRFAAPIDPQSYQNLAAKKCRSKTTNQVCERLPAEEALNPVEFVV